VPIAGNAPAARSISGSGFSSDGSASSKERSEASQKPATAGNALTRYFCPECGSPRYTSSPQHPEFFHLKAGCLDDPAVVIPTHQNRTRSRVPWAAIGPGLPEFP
jgi:hypothetical protein